ncbi:hypothetical protein NQ314_004573 [Rhamnusium bicolor]|uniref:Complex I assembly factor TIMMDC1, mitochondrial n=1 Tax=Rhamnusium bicolor TaxID=1586634 RepID=A0AAV8ZK74_9CUCU|nr:hypothetical protein NQ314_004573 [Rhamnusium bicolor]
MVRISLQNGCKYGFFPGLVHFFGGDQLDKVTETEKTADMSVMQNETGWDRVRRIFRVDEFGNISHEANSVLQVAAMSTFIGSIYGGVINSRVAYMEFMRNNEATAFKSHLEAKVYPYIKF